LGRIDYAGWGASIDFSARLSMRILPLFAALSLCLAASAVAREVLEVEPNDTIQTAQSIDAGFNWDIGLDPDIADSEDLPHVTIKGSGNNGDKGSFDYYKFTVGASGVRGIFDIDYGKKPGEFDFDSILFLYGADGTYLAQNDTAGPNSGGAGSGDLEDAYLEFIFGAPGTYVVGVARYIAFDSGILGQGIQGDAPLEGMTYELQVSIADHEMSDLPPLFPGDANRDGRVNLSDFTILKANFGKSPAIWDDADFDADSKVNLTDFTILKANFGKVQSGTGSLAVPEPSSAVLACLGLLLLIRRNLMKSQGKPANC
jgi:hypothetical protein